MQSSRFVPCVYYIIALVLENALFEVAMVKNLKVTKRKL